MMNKRRRFYIIGIQIRPVGRYLTNILEAWGWDSLEDTMEPVAIHEVYENGYMLLKHNKRVLAQKIEFEMDWNEVTADGRVIFGREPPEELLEQIYDTIINYPNYEKDDEDEAR